MAASASGRSIHAEEIRGYEVPQRRNGLRSWVPVITLALVVVGAGFGIYAQVGTNATAIDTLKKQIPDSIDVHDHRDDAHLGIQKDITKLDTKQAEILDTINLINHRVAMTSENVKRILDAVNKLNGDSP